MRLARRLREQRQGDEAKQVDCTVAGLLAALLAISGARAENAGPAVNPTTVGWRSTYGPSSRAGRRDQRLSVATVAQPR